MCVYLCIFCVCLWGCFWKRGVYELVGWIKEIPPHQCRWVSSNLWGLNRTGWWRKGIDSYLDLPLDFGTLGLSSRTGTYTIAPLVQTQDYYTGFPGCSTCRCQTMAPWSQEPIPMMNLHCYILLVLFLQKTMINNILRIHEGPETIFCVSGTQLNKEIGKCSGYSQRHWHRTTWVQTPILSFVPFITLLACTSP